MKHTKSPECLQTFGLEVTLFPLPSKPIGPVFKGQVFFVVCLTSEDKTDRMSQNVDAIFQKRENLNYLFYMGVILSLLCYRKNT